MSGSSIVVNTAGLQKRLGAAMNRKLIPVVRKRAEEAVQASNAELLRQFLDHEITREIEAGPEASNISGTLNGVGNLFTFLGFEIGSDPIQKVADFLSDCIQVRSVKADGNFKIVVAIKQPSKEKIEQLSQLPWADRSWIYAMETGIAGIGKYLYDAQGFETSRSGHGLQAEKNIRGGRFEAQQYMSKILSDVLKKLVLDAKRV